jgi:serine/threonine-protein kinase
MADQQTILCPRCHKTNQQGANFCIHCGFSVILNDGAPRGEPIYWITRIIKQGGQGSVFQGIDQEGNIYAIKEMRDRFTDPKERVEAMRRFDAEAEILQRLSHPRVPRVYSHFTDEGRHYLTMDFVQGEDLEHVFAQRGAIPEHEVLGWAEQICDVLEHLHGEGLVYRDVKPSNIMLDQHGDIKLVDFGIAKILKPSERGGTQIGTPGYAPPEQYQGLATPASDIYALGATLHHLLTGRDPTEEPPFSFPPAHTVHTGISQRTSDALERALQMQPEARYPTVRAFRAALLEPQPAPQQVRVAPAPAAQAASAAPPPAPQPRAAPHSPRSAAPPPPTPMPAAPQVRLPPMPPAPQTAGPPPPQKASRSSGVGVLVVFGTLFAVLLVLGGGAALFFSSMFSSDTQSTPGTAPNLAPARPLMIDVEATVPTGASNDEILAALRAAYETEVEQQHPGAVINRSTSIQLIGEWQRVGSDGGQAVYRATMQAFVALPQGP